MLYFCLPIYIMCLILTILFRYIYLIPLKVQTFLAKLLINKLQYYYKYYNSNRNNIKKKNNSDNNNSNNKNNDNNNYYYYYYSRVFNPKYSYSGLFSK